MSNQISSSLSQEPQPTNELASQPVTIIHDATPHERNGNSVQHEHTGHTPWVETARPLIDAVACHDMALVRQHATELIEAHEDKDIAYSTVARAFWSMGQLDVALEYYGIALALEPRSWLHYRSIGRLLRQMGRGELGNKI